MYAHVHPSCVWHVHCLHAQARVLRLEAGEESAAVKWVDIAHDSEDCLNLYASPLHLTCISGGSRLYLGRWVDIAHDSEDYLNLYASHKDWVDHDDSLITP